jgi:putative ABC transport system permease protein
MTPANFILASLRHHRRMHVAVGLGVAVATAVLTGALLVGDSVRGSLRDLTLQRLGRIDSALVTGHFFRDAMAEEVHGEPAILMPGTLEFGSGDDARRATQVSIVGVREGFWKLAQSEGSSGGPSKPQAPGNVAITEPLARELGVAAGDSILLRIPAADAIPADSPLGEKNDTSRGRRLRVAEVLPAEGLARFALAPSQQLPRNAFVPLATLANMLEQPGRANAILVAGDVTDADLKPQLEDYGLHVEAVDSPSKYVSVSSEQLVVPDAVVAAAEKAFAAGAFDAGHVQPVVTYLANSIAVGSGDAEKKIPYSTITGVDSVAGIGPLLNDAGEPIRLADDEIALNRWAANDLGAKVGETVTVTFYEPESTHGVLREHEPLELKLAHIVELEKDGRPTAAADPHLTPELKGVTDQDSISDWDLPFELVEKIRQQDEDYWDQYRTTPKAFVSLGTASKLWASRWGTTSLVRIPSLPVQTVIDKLAAQLKPADVGMTFLPVKRLGLAASSGTTPFDALFLGFSFFLIAAAVMLISLLFKLGVEQRAKELGTLGAIGLRSRKIAWILSSEGLLVAAIGAAVGLAIGVAYAWLIITGLRTWWVAAVSTPFMTLHVTPKSLIIGWLVGVIVSWLTIRFSIRRLARLPVGRLLAGATEMEEGGEKRLSSSWPRIREALVALAVALCVIGYLLRGESRAGIFFASGATVLGLLLGEVRYQLRSLGRSKPSQHRLSLAKLAAMNTARHPGRSTLTVGLVAMATFLIVAISAFRLDTGDAGTGGFTFVATSDQPIHFDLNTPAGRQELGFSDADQEQMSRWKVYSFRVADGEDASCLNLYRPTQPRVLGIPAAFVEHHGFGWAAPKTVVSKTFRGQSWSLLTSELGKDAEGRPIVPVVLDANTAAYSLHLSGVGAKFTIRDSADRPVTLEVVGLLKNSVLQGNLLVSESNFLKVFPDIGGYRYFLLDDSSEHGWPANGDDVARILESTLSSDGFDVVSAKDQLAGFLAVQNTYLSTFQSLGALGLLLGTVGLAIVQLRSVLERRGELALMRAGGFAPRRLVEMVLFENGVLLVGGLLVGLVAAAVAMLPQWAPEGASVPWIALGALLGTISVVGLLAGWLAARSAVRAPIVAALRGE